MYSCQAVHCCSNRCAALLKLQKAAKALTDADTCIRLKPDWEKGHYRKAMVLEAMGELSQVQYAATYKHSFGGLVQLEAAYACNL